MGVTVATAYPQYAVDATDSLRACGASGRARRPGLTACVAVPPPVMPTETLIVGFVEVSRSAFSEFTKYRFSACRHRGVSDAIGAPIHE
jgi:hypothetical protein